MVSIVEEVRLAIMTTQKQIETINALERIEPLTEAKLEEAIKGLQISVREVAMIVIQRSRELHLETEASTTKALYVMRDQMDSWFNSLSNRVRQFIDEGDKRFDNIWQAIDEDRETRLVLVTNAVTEHQRDKEDLLAAIKSIHTEVSMRFQGIEEDLDHKPSDGGK